MIEVGDLVKVKYDGSLGLVTRIVLARSFYKSLSKASPWVSAIKAPGGTPWLAQIHRRDPAKCDLWWPVEKLEVISESR